MTRPQSSPKISRRQALEGLAGIGIATLAGCSSLNVGRNDFQFDDSVPTYVRERCRQALDRTEALVRESPPKPLQVEMHDTGGDWASFPGPGDRLDRAARIAQHTAAVKVPDIPTNYYSNGTLSFLDYETVDFESAYPGIDVEPPEDPQWFPTEPTIAHEITHAIQRQKHENPTAGPKTSQDERTAAVAVLEGTAREVQIRYRSRCEEGSFAPCQAEGFSIEYQTLPQWALVAPVFEYVIGRQFVHALFETGGWDAVWAAHRDPPDSTAAVMFPERYKGNASPPPSDFSSPSTPDIWLELGSERLGAAWFAVKLHGLGVTEGQIRPDAIMGGSTDVETYSADILRGWRGDQFVAFGHADDIDRVVYQWETDWESTDAARTVATSVKDAYDERGTANGRGWAFDGRYFAVNRDGTRVVFRGTPTAETYTEIFAQGT